MRKFATLLTAIGVMFGKEITPAVLEAYAIALKDYDEADLVRVGADLMKGRFFPRPYDFIIAIEGPMLDTDELANLRWNQILNWAWDNGKLPDDPVALHTLAGVADKYMIIHGTNAEIRNAGFAFRGAYKAMLIENERKEKQDLLAGSEVRKLIENVGKEPPKEIK